MQVLNNSEQLVAKGQHIALNINTNWRLVLINIDDSSRARAAAAASGIVSPMQE